MKIIKKVKYTVEVQDTGPRYLSSLLSGLVVRGVSRYFQDKYPWISFVYFFILIFNLLIIVCGSRCCSPLAYSNVNGLTTCLSFIFSYCYNSLFLFFNTLYLYYLFTAETFISLSRETLLFTFTLSLET